MNSKQYSGSRFSYIFGSGYVSVSQGQSLSLQFTLLAPYCPNPQLRLTPFCDLFPINISDYKDNFTGQVGKVLAR